MGVDETCLNVFSRDMIVFLEDILDSPTLCEQAHDEFHGQSCAADNGLADQNRGINHDSIIHGGIIVTQALHCCTTLESTS